MRIEVAGEGLTLLAGRAAWWEQAATLFVADLHLGKGAAFRALGIPVPEGTTIADIGRLDAMVRGCGARRVVVLGDLLHARSGRSAEVADAFAAWRRRCEVEMVLVRGNHDERAGDPPEEWRIECVDGPVVAGPFVLRHEPGEDARGYVLCGHVHPAARLVGPAATMRVACFWVRERMMVLPAFGSFTGKKVVRPTTGDRVFAVDDEVIEVGALTPR